MSQVFHGRDLRQASLGPGVGLPEGRSARKSAKPCTGLGVGSTSEIRLDAGVTQPGPESSERYVVGNMGHSHRKNTVAIPAPASCARMKPGASSSRIPANVSLNAWANVTAGLANEVEAVNQ